MKNQRRCICYLFWLFLVFCTSGASLTSAFTSHRYPSSFPLQKAARQPPTLLLSAKEYHNFTQSDNQWSRPCLELSDYGNLDESWRYFFLSAVSRISNQVKIEWRDESGTWTLNHPQNSVNTSSSVIKPESSPLITPLRIHSAIQSLLGSTYGKSPTGNSISMIRQNFGDRGRLRLNAAPIFTPQRTVTDSASFVTPSTNNRCFLVTNGLLSVRVATPKDDPDIARLRLSVFTNLSPDDQDSFCTRSCKAIQHRRGRGAICIVASNTSNDLIIGTLEGSTQEFIGTMLEKRRPRGSILYVTEVAVSPSFRRKGAGTSLMKGIERLARFRGIETIYLHVDVNNMLACEMYRKVGFHIANKHDPMYKEFTTSLNLHDGATQGRIHHLLYKHLCTTPTWLDVPTIRENKAAVLGFEI